MFGENRLIVRLTPYIKKEVRPKKIAYSIIKAAKMTRGPTEDGVVRFNNATISIRDNNEVVKTIFLSISIIITYIRFSPKGKQVRNSIRR